MAIVSEGSIGCGFRGKLGGLVFRSVGGKTIVSAQPSVNPKRKLSARQQQVRERFSEAVAFAKQATRIPYQKLFYAAEARRLGLSNAYTAAVTLYLRGQHTQQTEQPAKTPTTSTPSVIQTTLNNTCVQYTTSMSTNATSYIIHYTLS